MIQFLIKSNLFARYFNKKCQLCNSDNDRDYIFLYFNNDEVIKLKEKYMQMFVKYLSNEDKKKVNINNIHNIIKYISFNSYNKKSFNKILKEMKKFVYLLLTDYEISFKWKKKNDKIYNINLY